MTVKQIRAVTALLQRIDEYKLCSNDSSSLEVDNSPMIIVDIVEPHYCRVDIDCELREEPLKVGKEGWIVEGPLRRILRHTFRACSYRSLKRDPTS